MRSALLCVFFTIIIQGEGIRAQSDDFRPTPIPLNEWNHKRRDSPGEVLHDAIQTNPSSALVPVHYWEDALRHSVYLTLVRDKIDHLIAKGDGISNSKTASSESKEIDDHDLWNKIKTAPFIRLPEEDPADIGDVTIMAKGRLLENKHGFSFVEDEKSKDNCSDDKCLQGVKAFWSVKRVRQRDHETSQGLHYELTFSVISQTPKKQKKPHENPIRTFTVRESFPKGIIDKPQEYRKFDAPKTRRPERALWFHKNIAPVKQIGRRQFLQGFDKLFTTLFSGDDARDYDALPTKYKQGPNGFPPLHQYSKLGYLGAPTDQHQIPYPYRLNQNKPIRPPLSVPPINPVQQTYLDLGQMTTGNNNLFSLYPYAHRDPINGIKTTRPAVLPTPLSPVTQRDYSAEVTHPISYENLDNTTILPDTMKYQLPLHNKYKPIPVKVNYFPENVRPPVYNAPPGVFVTMDKKPFKPLPPLKYLHMSKPHRPNRPMDFRPSPQVMDVLFADPDKFADTAFKPITVDYTDTNTTTTNDIELTGSYKKSENKTRKTTINGKKPLKKHENIKRVSTAVPEIITAQSSTVEEMETLEWANILGAFAKTTPMVSQTEQGNIPETTTPMTTTITTAIPKKRITTTTEAVRETTTTTTAPKKRTRPPPKLVKQEKIKKHKRITTTTSSTTTTTNAPENIKKRPMPDLTPQASSAATGTTKSLRESLNKTTSNATTTTSTTTTTTTTTPTPTTTLPTQNYILSTTQPKNKNRFRQSTLLLKGTSVNHDRWTSGQKTQLNTTIAPPSSTYRRKGSNFQGYVQPTAPRMTDEGRGYIHADRKPSIASTEASIEKITETTSQTQSLYEETVDQYESNSILPLHHSHEQSDTIFDENTNKDNSEYTFQTSSVENHKNEKSQPSIQLSSTPLAQTKNKTKCKKKKQNIVTTEEPNDVDSDSESLTEAITLVPATSRTAADISTGNDILDELLNFNFNSDEEQLNNTRKTDQVEENTKSDEFEDFLGALEGITKKPVDESQYDDEDDDNENDDDNYGGGNMLSIDSTAFGDGEDDEEDQDDEKESARVTNDDEPPLDRPFSFLELMAMS